MVATIKDEKDVPITEHKNVAILCMWAFQRNNYHGVCGTKINVVSVVQHLERVYAVF